MAEDLAYTRGSSAPISAKKKRMKGWIQPRISYSLGYHEIVKLFNRNISTVFNFLGSKVKTQIANAGSDGTLK